ncbi:hypothetical protein GCM10027299_37100 [Larkinella ripae]
MNVTVKNNGTPLPVVECDGLAPTRLVLDEAAQTYTVETPGGTVALTTERIKGELVFTFKIDGAPALSGTTAALVDFLRAGRDVATLGGIFARSLAL